MERLGIPDSPTRRVLFDLAGILDDREGGAQVALATAAWVALTKEFEEQFTPKSPLRVQAEYLRNQRELKSLGIETPDLRGEDLQFDVLPTTPVEFAQQLGYADGGRAVRKVLRLGFPDHDRHSGWAPLTPEQVNYVRAHLARR
ncbi:hypothetical protein DF220_03770 [Salinibacterium hongtaonis]|uniref:Uncharacterized protein n=1 Tax=Homoserinimonas hongtaonis TaxID=2079791 RepID=A0A2U1SZJ4_9MICO|nr:hypothetical protein DF220_03770 [Salinibacterium hongtaonis]